MSKRVRVDPQIGQVWRDRDPRSYSGNRRVLVVSSDPYGFVEYRHVDAEGNPIGRYSQSRYQRFQVAFELISDLPEDGR